MGIGSVFIVGAGPGGWDLISVRGWRALHSADVVIVDHLLPDDFLEQLGIAADCVIVERLAGGACRLSQDEINECLAQHALAGRRVVRLKGGDPFVFGRGSEEAQYLASQGIPYEVIPGQSSCIAALTAADIPITRHGQGRSFAVATARLAGGGAQDHFPRADTLVVMMGVGVLSEVVRSLIEQGWANGTPAAIVERGTTTWERRTVAALSTLTEAAREANVGAPALIVVGDAAAAVAEGRSAAGGTERKRILFTGLDPTSFRTLGDLIHWPALKIVADEKGLAQFPAVLNELGSGGFDVVIFTSKVGVASFFHGLERRRLDARSLSSAQVIAAGAGTELRLRECGIRADATPAEAGSDGILSIAGDLAGRTVLVVQGSHAPRFLCEKLAERGSAVTRLSLHRVVPHPELGRPLPEHDIIYFVSPSGVRAYRESYGSPAFQREVWCIGRVTQAELARCGVQGKVVSPHVSKDASAPQPVD